MRMLSKPSKVSSVLGVTGFPNFRPWGLLPVQPRSSGVCFRARPRRVPAKDRISLRFCSYFSNSAVVTSAIFAGFRSLSTADFVRPGNVIGIVRVAGLGSAGMQRSSWWPTLSDVHALGNSGSFQNFKAGERSKQTVHPRGQWLPSWASTKVGHDVPIRKELTEAEKLGLVGRGFESHKIFPERISIQYLFHLTSLFYV